MRKQILSLVCLAAMTSALTSCEAFLTVRPEGEVTQSELLSDASGFEDALYGVYSSLSNTSLYGKTLSIGMVEIFSGDYYYDNFSQGSVENVTASFRHESNDLKTSYNAIWKKSYQILGYVNNIIESLRVKDENSMRFYNLYKGEALGLRAFIHFDLLRLFAPQITEKNQNDKVIPYQTQWVPRITPYSTNIQVYNQIIADLLESEKAHEKALAMTAGRHEAFANYRRMHFNIDATRALLARVYLTKGDLKNAAIYAEKVIKAQNYKLTTPDKIAKLLAGPLAANECIFGLYSKALLGLSNRTFIEASTPYYCSKSLYTLYTTVVDQASNDMRKGWFTMKEIEVSKVPVTVYQIDKLYDKTLSTTPTGLIGINLIRIPEMYFILAESLLNTDVAKATTTMDEFLVSRGITSLTQNGLTATLELINNERKKEYVGEGQEFFNMKRQNRDVFILDKNATVKGSDEIYVIPIPTSEDEFRPTGEGKN